MRELPPDNVVPIHFGVEDRAVDYSEKFSDSVSILKQALYDYRHISDRPDIHRLKHVDDNTEVIVSSPSDACVIIRYIEHWPDERDVITETYKIDFRFTPAHAERILQMDGKSSTSWLKPDVYGCSKIGECIAFTQIAIAELELTSHAEEVS